MVTTLAPRRAARRASSPQPVPTQAPGSPAHPGPVEQQVDLAVLRGGEHRRRCDRVWVWFWVWGDRGAVGPRCEHRRGIGHGLVEEQREQFVRQIVVTADVAARAFPGLLVIGRVPAHRELAQPLLPGRHQVADVSGEYGEHPVRSALSSPRPCTTHRSRSGRRRRGGGRSPGAVQDHDRSGGSAPRRSCARRETGPQRQFGHPVVNRPRAMAARADGPGAVATSGHRSASMVRCAAWRCVLVLVTEPPPGVDEQAAVLSAAREGTA